MHSCKLIILISLCFSKVVDAETLLTHLPLLHKANIQYLGAFRLSADTFGSSSLNYSEGPLAYNSVSHSIYIVGHTHDQAIAEFTVPELSKSSGINDLKMVGSPLQPFTSILDRVMGGNSQALDRIGGLVLIDIGGQQRLLINAYEYYDAPADNTDTTALVENPGTLSSTSIKGFFRFQGGAGHTAGWISPVPPALQALFGGDYITGHSSGIPIIGRTTVGPSAFVFDSDQLASNSENELSIETIKLLDFSLQNPLHSDLENESGTNNIWTHLSRVVYGFLVPGTRTYLTLGHSGGHNSGVCYKCEQNNGNRCGGYCAPDETDYYPYYWLWDSEDLYQVKQGKLLAHEVKPYEFGIFVLSFAAMELGGGSFDPIAGVLYITAQKADLQQGVYKNPPIVLAYKFIVREKASLLKDNFEVLDEN